MFVMQDVHDETTDTRVAKHILGLHRQQEESAMQLSPADLQRYIRLARHHKPKITAEARKHLTRCYVNLRKDRHTYARGAAGVTVRQLESLIRLSEAIARVYLSEKITLDFVNQAFDLQLGTLKRAER